MWPLRTRQVPCPGPGSLPLGCPAVCSSLLHSCPHSLPRGPPNAHVVSDITSSERLSLVSPKLIQVLSLLFILPPFLPSFLPPSSLPLFFLLIEPCTPPQSAWHSQCTCYYLYIYSSNSCFLSRLGALGRQSLPPQSHSPHMCCMGAKGRWRNH